MSLRKINKWLIFHVFLCSVGFAGIQFESVRTLPHGLSLENSSNFGATRIENLDLSKLELKFNGRERFDIRLPGAKFIFQESLPGVPSLFRRVRAKEGYEAIVSLKIERVEKSVGAVPLLKTNLPKGGPNAFVLPPAPTEGLFPGNFLKTYQTSKETLAHVFPVQYDIGSGVLYILKEASLWVHYVPKVFKISSPYLKTPQAILVTSKVLKDGAEKLVDQQKEINGVLSQIVYVEDLVNEPVISEEELPEGYKDNLKRDAAIKPFNSENGTGYQYELSKKIIHFLQKRILAEGSQLRYVTLLGNAELVPPSYYFTLRAFMGKKWGVTDQCYGAVNKCLEPRVAVGRLPFSTNAEIEAYLEKSRRYTAQNKTTQKELSLMSGRIFSHADVYIGEVGALQVIQDPSTNWTGVEKIFQTKNLYNLSSAAKLATGEINSNLIYVLSHGEGNLWKIEDTKYSSKDVASAISVKSPRHPILVSMACSNAAFDETLIKENILQSEEFGDKSVGVEFLKAKGGPIAYWGEARPGVGITLYDFDSNGILNAKGSAYGPQLLEGFFESYHGEKKGRLGDFVLKAQRKFVLELGNNMKEEGNAWSYYITSLLGDPTLRMPNRPEVGSPNYALAIASPKVELVSGVPYVMEESENFEIPVQSPATVDVTVFKSWEIKPLQELKGVSGDFSVSLDLTIPEAPGTYFLRLENTEGVPREQQVWFNVLPRHE